MTIEETPNFRTCFAYNGGISCDCAALSEKLCETQHKCPFFKSHEQFEADRKEAARINREKTAITKNAISSAKVRR